jgi:glucose/mannose transport system substrate-binding protein
VTLLGACVPAAPTQLEIFSSWITGPEAVGLQELSDQFHAQHPDAVIINRALGAAGASAADSTLRSSMLAGEPPDSFQVRIGEGYNQAWVATGAMEPLTDVYERYGLSDALPPSLLEMVSYEGRPYSVPVNIHRANVLWYNKAVLDANGIDPTALGTFEGWQATAETLEAEGVIPLALGDDVPWTAAHLFEVVLVGTLGADAYSGLWTGETDWKGTGVTQALENFRMMVSYANPDHSDLTWDQANQLVIEGQAAMTIMGDWIDSDYVAKGFTGYGWVPPPGNAGIYDAVADGFGLPKDSLNPELAKEFLGLLGSREGQESLNKRKGSICARMDCDYTDFDAYLQASAEDWRGDAIVPSLAHGAAASESWTASFIDTIAEFVIRGDVAIAQAALAQACVDAGACK